MPVPLENLSVDSARFRFEPWDAGSKPGRTREPVRVGDFIYVPGEYNRVQDGNGTEYTRLYLQRVSALPPYALDTTWNPAPNGIVQTVTANAAGTKLYAGGQFTTIAGATRTRLAAFTLSDPTDPALDTSRFAGFTGPNGAVYALEFDGDGNLWVGGDFGSIGGSTRKNLAKLDVSTGTVTVMTNPNLTFSTSYVLDLAWDDVNNQMLVLTKNSALVAGTHQCKVSAVQTNGTINWSANPLGNTNATFQLDVDNIQAYVGNGGPNWTYAYRLTDGVLRWTYHTDGNNQGVAALGGYVYITHHGDWAANVKDNGTANSTTARSIGILALDQNGILQSWRPELRFPGGDAFGVSVLKGFDIGRDHVSGQLYVAGDFGGVYDPVSGDSLNSRRFAIFEGEGTTPPPPPGTFRLTVNIGGSGGGTVVSTPAGINSSSTAVFDFDSGEVVTLLATENGSSDPVNWSGSGTGSSPRSITMSADKSVTATFALTAGGGSGGYGGPGDGVPILLAGGDFLAGLGRPDGGRAGVAALLLPYFEQDDAVGFVTLGDHAYNDGTAAQFVDFDDDFGAMDRKNTRDFLMPTPGSHDYGNWGTTSSEVGMTAFDTYFEGLGLDVDNDDVANQFYRVDDIKTTSGATTAWRLLRINAVLAKSGFAQTQGGQTDGLIIPLKAGSPQYAFVQATMQAAKDDGKFLVIASAHSRWTSPSPTNHTNEVRLGPVWTLADSIMPGRCVMIAAHQHNYERFAPQTAGGVVDTDAGHVQFVAGTAGNPAYSVDTPLANSEALQWDDAGLLELTLKDDGYGYRFVLNDGSVFDEGTVTMTTGGGPVTGGSVVTSFDNNAVADGDNLTVGNSSGGGDALHDVVATGSGTSIKYETTAPAQGSKCVSIIVPGTTTTTKRGYIEHLLTTASAYPDVMVRLTQASWSTVLSGHRLDGTRRWAVVIRKDGRVELRDRQNATVATSTGVIPVGAWARIAVKAVLGATEAANILELRLFAADLNTVVETKTVTALNLGTVMSGLQDLYRAGLTNPSKLNRQIDLDMFRVQDSGYFGEVEPPPTDGWVFDASGPAGYGGQNALAADPNDPNVFHIVTDVGGYRRFDTDQSYMAMKGNSHESQRKTASIVAYDSGSSTRLLLAGGANPSGYSEAPDGSDPFWTLLAAVAEGANWNSQSPNNVSSPPDTDFVPHLPRATGHLTDFDGSRGLRYWGTFGEGVKRYPGTGNATVIAMAPTTGNHKWYIRDLALDPADPTKILVSTYNDAEGRGGVWLITGANTGTGKTPTKLTPAAIGQVEEIAFSDDNLRCYAACANDGIWRSTRASTGANFTSWTDISGSRLSKQVHWFSVDCYTNGGDDVVLVASHRINANGIRVDANGDPGATTGNRYANLYRASTAQTGSSPTWTYVCDPGTDGFPGGGDQDVNINELLTGRRWRKADETPNTMLGRRDADIVAVRWQPATTDGAGKHAMVLGAGGTAWLSVDNGSHWRVAPNGDTIVVSTSVFVDRARPAWGWQSIHDLDAQYTTDVTVAHPDWRLTPNIQNYTTAFGGYGAPDGTVMLLEGQEPPSTVNDGELLVWNGVGSGPSWTQIGGWNKVAGADTSVNGLPSARPLACTKVKLANGSTRWVVYLENQGIWHRTNDTGSWTHATGFPTFASGNWRQHDMIAPNAWWTGSNAGADGIVFLGVRDSANGGLWVSDDYGATWAKKVSDNGASVFMTAAWGQSSIVYLSGGSGVRRIHNPATMSLNQAARIDSITGFGGNTHSIAFDDAGTLYIFCTPSDGVLARCWQVPSPSTTSTDFPDKIDVLDPVDGTAVDDHGQAALQYVNNMIVQGGLLLFACSGGGVVRGRPSA